MKLVTYYPNDCDNASRPKNQGVLAAIVGYGKKVVPVQKDKEGNVTETKEVDAVNLVVFQDNVQAPVIHRSDVVAKADSESSELNYKLPYFETI